MAIKFLNTVQVDTDVLYVDASVNRVGINTATPIYDLDVDGAIRASEGFIDNEDNSALRVVSPPGGSFRSASIIVGAIEVTIPNSYVKDNVTFTLEVREAGYTAYTIKIAMAGSVGIDLFPTVVSAYLTSDPDVNNNCTIKYDGVVPEFDDVKIYIENPLGNFLTNTGVFITEFTVPATVADGNLAWGLNITSVPAAATVTFSNTKVTNWKRNGQDLYYGFGNVGIGTTTPSTDLEVSSTGVNGVDISQSASNASQSGRLFFTTNTASEGFALFNANGMFQINSGGIPNDTSGTNRISIIGSSGNVGIGTTSPSTKLHVSGGDIRIDDTEQLQFGAGGVAINNDAAGRMYSNAPLGYYWQAASSYKMVLLSSGNLGIGTTNPSEKLVVRNGTSNTDVKILAYNSALGTEATLKFSTIASETNYEKAAIIARNAAASFGRSDMHFALDSAADSGNVQFSDTKMTILNGGNVGIGTTSPDTKLEVSSLSGGVLRLTSTDTSVATGESIGRVEFKSNDASTGGNNVMGFVDCLATNAGSTYALTFGTGSAAAATEKMRINQSGNVGIGTTSPSELLHLSSTGPARLLIEADTDNITETDNAQIILKQDGGAVVGNLGYKTNTNGLEITNNYAAADGILTLGTSGIERMRIDYLGNVGIKTTSPITSLTLGTGSSGISFQSSSTTLNSGKIAVIKQVEVGNGNGHLAFETYQGGSGGGERMRILNDGNVGINTTDPKTKLHVVSGTSGATWAATAGTTGVFESSTGDRSFVTITGEDEAELWFGDFTTQAKGRVRYQTDTNVMSFWTNGSQKMTIDASGNVGIGVTSPSYQLQLSTNSAAKPSSSAWTVTSDSRVKENVRDYKTGLEAILSIEPKLYDYNGKAGFEKTKDNIGVIAQEIQEVMPETINTYKAKLNEGDEEETELLNFDSHAVTFALINAVKDLKAEIDELKKQINN